PGPRPGAGVTVAVGAVLTAGGALLLARRRRHAAAAAMSTGPALREPEIPEQD
ncbi:LPXTG cell wall anchor domain-containing protein, partial [Micromonospora aurantiaca]|nr:LPXTG cell wall anchor domain-containing protein [Micromonospora aurantiaca]